jgi:hypothetical protein
MHREPGIPAEVGERSIGCAGSTVAVIGNF